MAKLIGTGKDPRFPQGVDFDVPEEEVQHYLDAKLGEPVDPVTEMERIHAGEAIIAEDPQHEQERQSVQEQADYGSASRVAARVETTSSHGKKPSASGARKAAEKATTATAKADEAKTGEGDSEE